MRRLEKLTAILIFGPGATIQNGLFAKLPDQKISFLRPFLFSVLVLSCMDRLRAPTSSLWYWVHLFSVSIYLHLRSLEWVQSRAIISFSQFFTPRGQITGILSTTVSVTFIVALVFCYHCLVLMALFLMEQSMMNKMLIKILWMLWWLGQYRCRYFYSGFQKSMPRVAK